MTFTETALLGALAGFKDGSEGLGRPVLLAGMPGGGFAVGLAGLALGERRLRGRAPLPPIAGGAVDVLDPASVARGAGA